MEKNPNAMLAVLWAGFACGVLDITAAFVVYGFFGAKPVPLLQGIASGLLGPRAFQGGLATALLGLLCHFVIAFGAAAVYGGATVRCRQTSVFLEVDDRRRGHTHLLCRTSDIS